MTRILFICHGNICRSPMAEYIFMQMCSDAGRTDDFEIASAAVSREEIGNDIYPPARRVLSAHAIPFAHRAARQITKQDLDYYDHVICADKSNIRLLTYYLNLSPDSPYHAKLSLMMSWTGDQRDVSDPWYTGDFETAYRDIDKACRAILQSL